MLIDFYQMGGASVGEIVLSIGQKLLAKGERLILVAEDEGTLARLDRILWDMGRTTFLPHGVEGGADDSLQPILLSTRTDAPNLARNMLIADGKWRDAALSFDRAFFLFDEDTLEHARLSWKLLAGRDGVERRYWARDEDGRWTSKG